MTEFTGETARLARAEPKPRAQALGLALLLGVLGLAVLSTFLPKLGLAAAFLTFLAFLTRPAGGALPKAWATALLVLAALSSAFGTVTFLMVEAPPGIVQGSRAAQAQSAVSELRLILRAEDALRKNGYVDPDKDGIGSAGFIDELLGVREIRGGGKLPFALLDGLTVVADREGPLAFSDSYFFRICLPEVNGSFSARSEARVDDERAEREYWAYAWPEDGPGNLHLAFAMDQDERLFVSGDPDGAPTPFRGAGHAPTCDSARGAPPDTWRVWRGKQGRQTRPGDK